jgi:hypothetical protein
MEGGIAEGQTDADPATRPANGLGMVITDSQ